LHDARATHCVDLTESPSCAIVTDTMSGHHRRTRDTGLPTRVCLKPPQGLITRSCNFGRVGGVWPHRAPDTGLFKAPGANHPNASQLRAGRGGLATQGTREPKRKTKPPRSTAKPGPGAGNKLCARQSDQQRLLLRMLASACTAASRRRRPSRRCQQWHPARAPAASRAPAKRPAAPAAPSGRSTQASATRRAPPSRKRRPSRRCQQRPAQGASSEPAAPTSQRRPRRVGAQPCTAESKTKTNCRCQQRRPARAPAASRPSKRPAPPRQFQNTKIKCCWHKVSAQQLHRHVRFCKLL
jgi:hypothetical protein